MPDMDNILKKKAVSGKTPPPPQARMSQISNRLEGLGFARPVAPAKITDKAIEDALKLNQAPPLPASPTSTSSSPGKPGPQQTPLVTPTGEITLADVQDGKFDPRFIYDVPLSWLDFDDQELTYNREETGVVDLADLEEDMKEKGQIEPGFVRINASGRLQIVQGWRRALTARKIKLSFYRCVITKLSDQEAAILSLSLNLNRKDIPDYQKIQKILQFSEKYDLTQEEIGRRTGFGKKSYISQVMNIRHFPAVMEALKAHKLNLSEASKISMKAKKDGIEGPKLVKLIDLVHRKTVKAQELAYLDVDKVAKKDKGEAVENYHETKNGGFTFRCAFNPDKTTIREMEKDLKTIDRIRQVLFKAVKERRK